MIQIASGILGAVAVTLAVGAIHLEVAAGNDLPGVKKLVSPWPSSSSAEALQSGAAVGEAVRTSSVQTGPVRTNTARVNVNFAEVNRAGKGDRAASPAGVSFVTLAFKLSGVPESSILVRVPTQALRTVPAAPAAKPTSPQNRAMPACEPAVSVLTGIAKQLQPARCDT